MLVGQNCSEGFRAQKLSELASSSSPESANIAIPTPNPSATILDCKLPNTRGSTKSGIHRLNRTELVNTLQQILNWWTPEYSEAVDAYSDLTDMTEVTNFSQTYSQDQMEQWAKVTDVIAQIASTPQSGWNPRQQLGGDCFTADPISKGCWSQFFTRFGKKVYRHPLDANDIMYLESAI